MSDLMRQTAAGVMGHSGAMHRLLRAVELSSSLSYLDAYQRFLSADG